MCLVLPSFVSSEPLKRRVFSAIFRLLEYSRCPLRWDRRHLSRFLLQFTEDSSYQTYLTLLQTNRALVSLQLPFRTNCYLIISSIVLAYWISLGQTLPISRFNFSWINLIPKTNLILNFCLWFFQKKISFYLATLTFKLSFSFYLVYRANLDFWNQ